MKLTLPLCPSVNHCYGLTVMRGKSGKLIPVKYLKPEAKRWKVDAGWEAVRARNKQGFEIIGNEKFVMEINIWWKDKRNGDCDNLLKLLQDSLKGILFLDDKFCLPRFINFFYDKLEPRIELEIYKKEKL